jgi:hypothetical protein
VTGKNLDLRDALENEFKRFPPALMLLAATRYGGDYSVTDIASIIDSLKPASSMTCVDVPKGGLLRNTLGFS